MAHIVGSIGFVLGGIAVWVYHRLTAGGYQRLADDIIGKAELEVEALRHKHELDIKHKEQEYRKDVEKKLENDIKNVRVAEERIRIREDKLEDRRHAFDKKVYGVEKREEQLSAYKKSLADKEARLSERETSVTSEVERLAGVSRGEARDIILKKVEDNVNNDAAALTRRIVDNAKEHADREANKVIVTAIGRLAVPCVSDAAIAAVPIPNDEMKGRIIGREGRNIRALEHATGANFIIDDTPNAVVISTFDAVRKEVAKIALTELIADGRIHPTRIEEVVAKAQHSVERQIKDSGEDAAMSSGALNLHPEIASLLGKLKFRYSFGQNALDHSIEVSRLMGIMAAELSLNGDIAKRIGILHDIGKAVAHDHEGSHANIGADIAKKYGEDDAIVNGIRCHHEETPPSSLEAALCSAADAISAARPGARVEAVDHYLKRLKNLEDIAYKFPGVEKAYAMQAGREIRVMLMPEMIDDAGSINIARDLANNIKAELSYPGKIKVTVIREKRTIEYAT